MLSDKQKLTTHVLYVIKFLYLFDYKITIIQRVLKKEDYIKSIWWFKICSFLQNFKNSSSIIHKNSYKLKDAQEI